ncbi:hypothetical protein NV379_00770 [Paenibacillus sp. N1-5-1-14]|uniref:hypothetical protein n=1 Tax=Paenibacillus radicibacter TaxID=2972488 RepID=UPI002158F277|nr:hypothetical protein [Paenibacillus radicibacter]MCR8641175.1 hypothetical protein [Paenibacillus radicibacter]
MNRFIKLLEWEISRFSKVFLTLLAITIVSQFAGVYVVARSLVRNANRMMSEEMLPISSIEPINISSYSQSIFFLGPIALCVAVLLLYVFFIWYKEWWGKNTFAYRLMMLPTSRMNVYMAKLSAILLFTISFVALQLILLNLQNMAFNAIVPNELLVKTAVADLVRYHFMIGVLYPDNFVEFLYNYGTGVMCISVVFTVIMLERSFRWKGILTGVGYGLVVLGICLIPYGLDQIGDKVYFYNSELFIISILTRVIVLAGSLWFSSYLIRRRISV